MSNCWTTAAIPSRNPSEATRHGRIHQASETSAPAPTATGSEGMGAISAAMALRAFRARGSAGRISYRREIGHLMARSTPSDPFDGRSARSRFRCGPRHRRRGAASPSGLLGGFAGHAADGLRARLIPSNPRDRSQWASRARHACSSGSIERPESNHRAGRRPRDRSACGH
jgi:hypothetical protein